MALFKIGRRIQNRSRTNFWNRRCDALRWRWSNTFAPRVGASSGAPTKLQFLFLVPIHLDVRRVGLEFWHSVVRFRHLPSGGTSRCEGWDLQISKDTDLTATEAEIAVSVPGSVFYTIFLSNISGGNILILLRRAKFQAIHTRCKGMDLDGAGTGSEQDRRAAERQHSATVER